MRIIQINLKAEDYNVTGGTLTAMLMDEPFDVSTPSWQRPAVLIAPGGAYAYTSNREAEPVALEFLARGFQAFVLHYQTVGDGVCYPQQLVQIASAIDCIKKHAKVWRVNVDEVFAVGFSAGGHLVGNISVAHGKMKKIAGMDLRCKPTAVALCYPVISKKYNYQQTHVNLLNGYTDEEKEALYPQVNLDENVTKDVPPTYIWTTATDSCVPAKNALGYAFALAEHGVPYELHVFSRGEHGLSCANAEINGGETEITHATRVWLDECVAFFRRYIQEPF